MTTHSLRNILNQVKKIQSQLTLSEIRQASRSEGEFQQFEDTLFSQLAYLIEAIERNLTKRELSAAELAIRSRRAYQWLIFLSERSALAAHLDLLQRTNLFLDRIQGRKSGKIAFKLYHQAPLYKITHNSRDREIIVQESFINASNTILSALLEIVHDPSSQEARAIIRDYTFTKEYRKTREKLEYLGIPPGSLARGQIYDLEDSYRRVNQEYFQGKMAQPHLVWNNRLTHRKFGHYQWDTDTILVSSTLDQRGIPPLVVDFVMYHELLHKKLGARRARQNRIAHTREFRELERQFKKSDKAKQQLNRIARQHR